MKQPDIWILTPAPRRRLRDLNECHETSGIPYPFRVTVTNPPDAIQRGEVVGHLVSVDSEEINISKWWNAGLEYIRSHYDAPGYSDFHVFLAESDIRISNEDINKLSQALTKFGAGVAGANWYGLNLADGEYLYSETNRHWGSDEKWRFPGVGCLIDGSLLIDFDEERRWHFADCEILFRHREASGSVLVGGTSMSHSGGTPMDADRLRYAAEDKIKFMEKWKLESY